MSPRFSVIIPAFNAADTLARAIESVRVFFFFKQKTAYEI